MSRVCELDNTKKVLVGNKVSHSNVKTKKRFLPSLHVVSLMSDALGHFIRFKATSKSVRAVEHNNGLDGYLLKTSDKKLSPLAKNIKKQIKKTLLKKDVITEDQQ